MVVTRTGRSPKRAGRPARKPFAKQIIGFPQQIKINPASGLPEGPTRAQRLQLGVINP